MRKALLVIDVQNEYFTGKMKVTYPINSFDNILAAMDYAKESNMLIIIIQHTALNGDSFVKNTDEWKVHRKIMEKHHDYILEKNKSSSFHHTDLDRILQNDKIETVVISGYMTQMCCDTTAREANHKGYKVEFLLDATGTIDVSNQIGSITSKQLHEATLIAQSIGFSNVISVKDWMKK
ncbi:cysteine hydrolase family protein [Acetoanaerobium noterae]|uniref:cysteine hydrolase family protein n=1 Tax=Acetoanaerobium noterae TaxID=745369 RepID=UPI0028A64A3A|nr:cysteine hydrolase family protein [Acetoanaerobium noterae]